MDLSRHVAKWELCQAAVCVCFFLPRCPRDAAVYFTNCAHHHRNAIRKDRATTCSCEGTCYCVVVCEGIVHLFLTHAQSPFMFSTPERIHIGAALYWINRTPQYHRYPITHDRLAAAQINIAVKHSFTFIYLELVYRSTQWVNIAITSLDSSSDSCANNMYPCHHTPCISQLPPASGRK